MFFRANYPPNAVGADDIRMYISQASYTFNDMPSLRLG